MRCNERRDRSKIEARRLVERRGLSITDLLILSMFSGVRAVRRRPIDDLKITIREEIATVPPKMLVNVMQNFEEMLRTCVRQEGRHFSDIIFRN